MMAGGASVKRLGDDLIRGFNSTGKGTNPYRSFAVLDLVQRGR
jgi:hypothetical protein